MSLKHIVILLLGTGMVVGCSSVPKDSNQEKVSRHWHKPGFVTPDKTTENNPYSYFVRDRLYNQYEEWRGVRYRLGGSDHSGIDCSAFVKIIYEAEFGLSLPRTALSQANLGSEINQNKLMPGDLVFFKTGRYSQHVGIYLDSRQFLHVSTRKGVTISQLDNAYWKSRYWKAVRI